MSSSTIFMNEIIYDYLKNNSLRESPVLTELREITAKMPGARMQISPDQGQFMAMLVKLMGATRILEIGVFTGYSSTVMAMAMPAHGLLDACDCDETNTRIAKETWEKANVSHKINLHINPALDTLIQLKEKHGADYYDLVFIDADKQNYERYYENALTLLKQGGLILIDNTLWSGRVADEQDHDKNTETIRALNKKLHEDKRVDISLLPVGDGLTLLRKV